MRTPFEQFKVSSILKIGGTYMDITISNNTIYMIIGAIIPIIIVKNIYSTEGKNIRNRYNIIVENIYTIWEDHLRGILGEKSKRYQVIIINIFILILISNLLGLIPYSFTTTAQIIVSITLSSTIFLGVTIIGIKQNGFNFVKMFIPSGIPKILIPLIFIIETISYCSRIISLSVRLTANMISGHTILNIISGFGVAFLSNITPDSLLFALLFNLIIIPIIGLELFVAVIQSYVFAVLTATYVNDVTSKH